MILLGWKCLYVMLDTPHFSLYNFNIDTVSQTAPTFRLLPLLQTNTAASKDTHVQHKYEARQETEEVRICRHINLTILNAKR